MTLSYAEFCNKIRDLDISIKEIGAQYLRGKKIKTGVDTIGVSWETGGYRGGSCYGDKAERYTVNEREPEFEDLDKILECFAPQVTFLQYKRLYQELVKEGNDCEADYYGNSTDYHTKSVNLKDLYGYLQEKSWV